MQTRGNPSPTITACTSDDSNGFSSRGGGAVVLAVRCPLEERFRAGELQTPPVGEREPPPLTVERSRNRTTCRLFTTVRIDCAFRVVTRAREPDATVYPRFVRLFVCDNFLFLPETSVRVSACPCTDAYRSKTIAHSLSPVH